MTTLESLESRRLMTSTLDADGTLSIHGTEGDDSIIVWQPVPEVMRVDDNGAVTDYATANVKKIYVAVGKGNDLVILGRREIDAVIYGGTGNDSLSAGRGNDTVYGDGGDDYLFGGDGNDELHGGDGTGHDADDIYGGHGRDVVDYSARTRAVNLCIGYVANDGEEGEHDNLHVDIEVAHGGEGDDQLINWGPSPVEFHGHGGDDHLVGGPDNDLLDGGDGEDELKGAGGFDSYLAKDGQTDVIITGTGLSDVQHDAMDDVRSA
jgi:Ca2+-binding RTX toxin-like protein